MAEKILNTRIQLRYDTLVKWNASTDILKKGEIAIATIDVAAPANKQLPPVMFKVGDGTKTFSQLDWASALAADVYGWAKQAGLNVDATPIADGEYVTGIKWENDTLKIQKANLVTDIKNNAASTKAATTKAVKEYVDAQILEVTSKALAIEAGDVIAIAPSENDSSVTVISHAEVTAPTTTEASLASGDTVWGLVAHGENDGIATDGHGHITDIKRVNLDNRYKRKLVAPYTANGGVGKAVTKVTQDGDGNIEVTYDDISITAGQISNPDGVYAGRAKAADKVVNALTIGEKVFDGSEAITVTAGDLGLSGAMHFIGIESELPETGNNGDVVIVGGKEYVWADDAEGEPKWQELGDETSFALKTVQIIANNGLAITGNNTLSGNVTIGLDATTSSDIATAKSNAASAVETANEASGTAGEALEKAEEALEGAAGALASKNAAEEAQAKAEAAQGAAEAAKGAAEGFASTASTKAQEAAASAGEAKGYSETASTKAQEATEAAAAAATSESEAEKAQAAAETAKGDAEKAKAAAETAQAAAKAAQGAAENAQSKAEAALALVEPAKETAVAAAGTATEKAKEASDAESEAKKAQAAAEEAQKAAEDAQAAAEASNTSATAIANDAKTLAGQANETAGQAKTLAGEAKAAVEALDSSVTATAEANNQISVLTGITQENGKLTAKTEAKLAAIAKTGNVNDLIQTKGDVLVFNCGDATGNPIV